MKMKERNFYYELDENGIEFCYMWLEKFHPVLKRVIKYRVDFDLEDLDFIKSKNWFIHDWGYVFYPLQVNGKTVKTIYMHRQIAQHLVDEGKVLDEVDHIDWNKMNNRRENLRAVNRQENEGNKPPKCPFGRHYIQTIHSKLYQAYAPNIDSKLPAILIGEFSTRQAAIKAQEECIEKRMSVSNF